MNNRVLELLKRKSIEYVEKGDDALVLCLNPEHEDSAPSMRINKTDGRYHCFSCGFGGKNIFEYFNEYFNPVVRQALELQAQISNIMLEITGIEIPEGAEFYLGNHRGIPPSLYAKYKAFQHPNFDDRLCFPIPDISGKIVCIIARNMHSKVPPKYKVYPEGRSAPIYPHIKGSFVVLVEGIYDVLNLEKLGVPNVACMFGTQSISYKSLLDKFTPLMLSGVRDVFILLDNDKAGNSAAESLKKGLEYQTNLRVHILNEYLPPDKDPGEIEEADAARIKRQIEKLVY